MKPVRSVPGKCLWLCLAIFSGIGVAEAQTSSTPFTSYARYDDLNRKVGEISASPDGTGQGPFIAERYTYDSMGRMVRAETGVLATYQADSVLPASWSGFVTNTSTEFSYDAAGRKTLEVAKGSDGVAVSAIQYSYDAYDRPVCTAVRMNPAVYGSLPSDACVLGPTGVAGPDRITRNSYTTSDDLWQVKKAYGITTAGGFSETLEQDYVTYTINANGDPITVKDANGNVATYTYDGYARLVAWAFPSKTVTGSSAACTIGTIAEATDGFGNTVAGPSETRTAGDDCEKYAYDRDGNRARLMKRDGNVIRYAFDALNRNTIKDIPGGTAADVYFGYDLRGLQTFARFVSTTGPGITNTYDGFGQLVGTTNNMGFAPLALGYLYDADGNRIRITHPDGTYFTYDYDGLDRTTTIKVNGTATIATITYDNQGRRQGDTRAAVNTTYGYDPVSRLASLSNDLAGTASDLTSTFTYNPANQIVTKTRSNDAYTFTGYVSASRPYNVNGLNQYTAAGSASFSYDDNGNLTGDGTNSYTYDVENRMVSATVAGATNTIIYDPLGRLWQIAGPTSWQYLQDGDRIVEKYGISGTNSSLNSRFVFGPGNDEPLIWYIQSDLSNPRSFQRDAQGSIVSTADANGNVSEIIAYDEYGISSYTTNVRPLFGYTGQVWLPMIGLNYYKARMYSPTLGRFMQTDPIGYKDQTDLYSYVGNDPINQVDPSGKQQVCGPAEICVTGTRPCAACHAPSPPPPPLPTWPTSRPNSPPLPLPADTPWIKLPLPSWKNWTRDVTSACFWILVSCNTGVEPSDGATPLPDTKGRTKLWEKPGGEDEANDDFDAAEPENVQSKGNGLRVGKLPDGRTIVVRPFSSDGRPTVEVRNPANGRGYEVRYGTKP